MKIGELENKSIEKPYHVSKAFAGAAREFKSKPHCLFNNSAFRPSLLRRPIIRPFSRAMLSISIAKEAHFTSHKNVAQNNNIEAAIIEARYENLMKVKFPISLPKLIKGNVD